MYMWIYFQSRAAFFIFVTLINQSQDEDLNEDFLFLHCTNISPLSRDIIQSFEVS